MNRNIELKRRFLEYYSYIENNNWLLSAFYSDNEVAKISKTLIEKWIKSNKKGEPLDYASRNDLIKLIRKARIYCNINPNLIIRNLIYTNNYSLSIKPKSGITSKFLELIRRLILPGL